MATSSSKSPIPKLCTRCGAFYQDLPSKTCPQCFAKLDILSDEQASALIAEQEARAQDPEILRAKEVEDEHFREQSFGACLGVIGILILTAIVSALLIYNAAHRQHAQVEVRQNLPGDFDQIIPAKLASSARFQADTNQELADKTVRIYHATFDNSCQVFALQSKYANTANVQMLELVASASANQHSPPYLQKEVGNSTAHYVVMGSKQQDVSTIAADLEK